MIQFGHIELFVADPLAAMLFYRDVLGFELETIQEEKYVWMKHGEKLTILLRPGRNESPGESYQRGPTGFVLYTDDVKTTASVLRARGLKFRGTDGSDECLTFTDPDGNWFQLVNPKFA